MIGLTLARPYGYAFVDAEITIVGITVEHRLLVDTGAYGLVLGSDRATLYGKGILRTAPTVPGAGIGGAVNHYRLTASRVRLHGGALPLMKVEVDFPASATPFRDLGFDGLIGTRELRRLGARLTVNYKSGRGGLRF